MQLRVALAWTTINPAARVERGRTLPRGREDCSKRLPSAMRPLAVILPTHTDRHLRRTLLAVAASSRRPDLVVVSCDGDKPELEACVKGAAAEFALPIVLVTRPHSGRAMPAQVRNNGVRAAIAGGLSSDATLVFLDGDSCPARDCFAAHERLCDGRAIVAAALLRMTPQQTEQFDEAAVKNGQPPAAITTEQWGELRTREKRYRRSVFWRRLGLAKSHKPKLIGGNFCVPLAMYIEINGMDEEFFGWGVEDDDMSRRMYAVGAKPAVGVLAAIAYHQWHPTRAPGEWGENQAAKRFAGQLPVRCVHGLENPLEQGTCRVQRFSGS